MTTIVARRFAATPQRTGVETWTAIAKLLSSESSEARKDLEAVAGIMASIIVGETPAQHPFIVTGNGPRLRVYCVYGQDAITGEDCNEDSLSWIPADGDWKMLVPCEPEEVDWLTQALRKHSSRMKASDITDNLSLQEDSSKDHAKPKVEINVERFKKS
jgi:hypothetical protein